MKELFFIALLAFSINAKAQFTLEHTYDSASTISSGDFLMSQLLIVNFELSGEKFIKINNTGKELCVYNLNHSLLKTISYAGFPQMSNGIPTLLYFSENLFNNDSLFEFMYIINDIPGIYHTYVYNENGICLFSKDSVYPMEKVNVPQIQFPIFNTSQGTKMLLSHQYNGKVFVYNLSGTLSTNISEANKGLIAQGSISNPYPNPSESITRIEYSLPDNINQGEIVFYDTHGHEIKRFKVDRAFNTLHISTSDIPSGIYYYQLQTTGQNSQAKKMVVIK